MLKQYLGRPGNSNNNCIKQLSSMAASLAITLLSLQPAVSAPLSLAQSPLFVSSAAPANIFFLADDSGSMDWNMVTTDHDGTMLLTAAHSGTTQSASNTGTGSPRIILAAAASSTNGNYNNMVIKITGGTGAGQVRNIIAYNGAARRVTVDENWDTIPNNTSTYSIYVEYTYVFPQADNNYAASSIYGRILPSEAAVIAASNMPANAHGVWRGRYSGYNKIYYNPDINYQPWPGVDSAGNPLPNAKASSGAIAVTALRLDPYLATSATVNITSNMSWTSYMVPRTTDATPTSDLNVTGFYPAQYYTWTDSNSNSVVDATDTHTLYEIRSASDSSCSTISGVTVSCPATFVRAAARSDCAIDNGDGTRTCTRTEELKNFANWFMYFRRRELTAKNAIGNVINPSGSEVRMGHGTLHNNSGASNVQVATMNSSNTSGAKKALLDAVYQTASSNGTPLRTKLDQVGKYYECVNGSIFGSTGSYTCPYLSAASGGTCQQSFAIMTTDGFYNDSFSGLGNADADGNSPNATGNTAFDGGAYADTYSNTLADVAMNYYERDLSPLANNVPVVVGIDSATHQHMVTYTVAFGVTGTLSAGPTDASAAFAWPDPILGDAQKIDDLRHAAYDGRGKFLSASDPTALADSLKSTIDSIASTTGSASAVAVNSRTLTTGTTLYQARFTSVEWSGDLRAVSLNATTGNIGSEIWSAANVLKTQTGRVFLTYRQRNALGGCTGGGSPNAGVAFTWSNLSPAQQCLLNDNPETALLDDDSKGSSRLSYLRGDATLEGASSGQFRIRSGGFKLGDIVNSTPTFVGAPGSSPPDSLETVTHSSFSSTHAARREMLYVGANDGMLHGFDAASGQEKIAYVPSQVYINLGKLTDPINYKNSHLFFVDGSPTVTDAFGTFPYGCSSTACWRTVLVGGLAGGGKGIYALDVTDPDGAVTTGLGFSESNAANIVMWEYIDSTSATPDNDMGYVYGEVSIAKMKNGKWAAIFGNGYNSVNENAVLYIVDITDGSLIRKIVLNPYVSTTGNSNGLSAPAVFDRDNDFVADFIYAGDLRGNLWKIDVSDPSASNWQSAHISGTTSLPLFKAVDGASATTVEQAITARPVIRKHPDTSQTGYMVYVGTGRYVASGDKVPTSSPINTFYGIWDKNINGSATPVARSNLLAQTITQTTAGVDLNGDGDTLDTGEVSSVRIVSSNTINWSTHLGWALNLRTNQTDSLGEMSVSNPVLATSAPERLIFTTLVPTQTACEYGGTSWLMEISPTTGGNLAKTIFDINGDGVIDTADNAAGQAVSGINPGMGIVSEPVIVTQTGSTPIDIKLLSGSTGAVGSVRNYLDVPPGGGGGAGSSSGRRSWRQLK